MDGKIYINGAIGTFLDENGNVIEKGIELLDVIMQVKNQPKAESFTVYINSQGGYVDVGFEIYDYLKSLGKPIKTVGQGMVASIATVIFMAGETRVLKPNTDFMIHLPSGGVEGNSDEIENYSKYIKETEKRILKFYHETAGLTETEILPLLRKETFLSGDEAYKIGFATEKISQPEAVAIFKPNPNKKSMSTKTKPSIWEQVTAILKGHKILNKIVFDAEGKELDFYELEENATIELGAKARYDGQDANGEYKVQSEEDASIVLTYVFENGVLMEIKEPEVVGEADAEEMQALKDELEALKTQIAEKETAVVDLTEQVTNLKKENKSYKEAITAIRKLEGKLPTQPAKEKQEAIPAVTNKVSDAVTNWKRNKQLKNKK
jgi:ATP-dependent Clp endopeptidase proteolytic subunit ClpP